LLLLTALPAQLAAQPLDDVTLAFQNDGIVATIRTTAPIHYLRHFPSSHGKTLEISYERVSDATTDEVWKDNEVRKSPPSRLIPSFTVTTRDQQNNPRLVIEFSREAEYSVAPGPDNRSLLITIIPDKHAASTGPLPKLPIVKQVKAAAADATLTPEEANIAVNNQQGYPLMTQGRDALSDNKYTAAIDAFNKLLLLPPNDYTQDAQAWIGVARERAGQPDKAEIEYALYLRLYPDGKDAGQVAQRLAGLSSKDGKDSVLSGTDEKKRGARLIGFGSLSSRYYFGHSKTDTTYTFNNVPVTSSFSQTDQSMLITSVDASERYTSEQYDGRLVFRDTNTKNFLSNQRGMNLISAAYGEIKDRKNDYMLRLGRQASIGGGVSGRFDGLSASYGNAQDMRYNGVVGMLSVYAGSQPHFASVSVDKGPFSVYAINQTVDGVTDRRALGTEFRYFEGNHTAYALLDYDTNFKALNSAQFMGSTAALGGTVNFMMDHRRGPSLSMLNALNGAATASINDLLQSMTPDELRALALARTATTNMGQIGLTLPFNKKWQLGGDIRLSNTTGLPESGCNPALLVCATKIQQGYLAATPGRGTEVSLSTQATGSGILTAGDIWTGSVTLNKSSSVRGYSLYLYNHNTYGSKWNIDPSLQFSNQKDQFNTTIIRTSPMLRASYQIREQLYFDTDGGIELIRYSGAQQTAKTFRYFFSSGLRWDF